MPVCISSIKMGVGDLAEAFDWCPTSPWEKMEGHWLAGKKGDERPEVEKNKKA